MKINGTVKKIADGAEYHARFKRTKIFRLNQSSETLLEDYMYLEGDEDYSEVIFLPSAGRGMLTWFNFNKIEKVIDNGVLDYHKNLPIGNLAYSDNGNIEMAQFPLFYENGSAIVYAFIRMKNEIVVNVAVVHENGNKHFKIEFSQPDFININEGKNTLFNKLKGIFR
jgi:hypothetical protein